MPPFSPLADDPYWRSILKKKTLVKQTFVFALVRGVLTESNKCNNNPDTTAEVKGLLSDISIESDFYVFWMCLPHIIASYYPNSIPACNNVVFLDIYISKALSFFFFKIERFICKSNAFDFASSSCYSFVIQANLS